jgi:hypothetical protein
LLLIVLGATSRFESEPASEDIDCAATGQEMRALFV